MCTHTSQWMYSASLSIRCSSENDNESNLLLIHLDIIFAVDAVNSVKADQGWWAARSKGNPPLLWSWPGGQMLPNNNNKKTKQKQKLILLFFFFRTRLIKSITYTVWLPDAGAQDTKLKGMKHPSYLQNLKRRRKKKRFWSRIIFLWYHNVSGTHHNLP